MDSFNKVISFVLGLVVVLVFFAVVTGKINLKSKTSTTANSKITISPTPVKTNTGGFFSFLRKASPTPTPTSTLTQKPLSSITIDNIDNNENNTYKDASPKSIPSAGLPTIFIPILLSGLAGGNFLRKIGKK